MCVSVFDFLMGFFRDVMGYFDYLHIGIGIDLRMFEAIIVRFVYRLLRLLWALYNYCCLFRVSNSDCHLKIIRACSLC